VCMGPKDSKNISSNQHWMMELKPSPKALLLASASAPTLGRGASAARLGQREHIAFDERTR
jgi:hypothetical protein